MKSRIATRRQFLKTSAQGLAGAVAITAAPPRSLFGQAPGTRPVSSPAVQVLNPRHRVPVGIIIDDSACLVNLNRFAMPQFNEAWNGNNKTYHRNWREWPVEIPDSFVRKFGEWAAHNGVKGKYSIVPYPACVGRLDLETPGWTRREIRDSIKLVQTLMMPNWDIHPEMVTHTRVIDLKTGHPYPEYSPKYMENWEWTAGRGVDELAAYLAYALNILKNVDLPCEGVTTPGGFGNQVLPELSQATLESVRDVFQAEIPHYFRHLYAAGERSVAPRVEYAGGLDGDDPRCCVSIIGCTGDWTGGWDNTPPGGADKFITPDLQSGRMVEVIERGEPALMVCHWTGIHWNGEERGFKIFQEVVNRLHRRFDNLLWMKLSDVARYWAARELTRIEAAENRVTFHAPFACPGFTVRLNRPIPAPVKHTAAGQPPIFLNEVPALGHLQSGTWHRQGNDLTACFDLPKGRSTLDI